LARDVTEKFYPSEVATLRALPDAKWPKTYFWSEIVVKKNLKKTHFFGHLASGSVHVWSLPVASYFPESSENK
jgi:hypothetical protein